MTTEEFIKLHTDEALRIMADKSLVNQNKPLERAGQLVVSTRHLLCCWLLKEATEEQLFDITDRYASEFSPADVPNDFWK